MEFDVRQVTADLWPDLEDLFGDEGAVSLTSATSHTGYLSTFGPASMPARVVSVAWLS